MYSFTRTASLFTPKRVIPTRSGVKDFFEQSLIKDKEKKTFPPVGRAWKASELRLKSFEDLHKLWFVLLKEKNILLTEKETVVKTKGDPAQLGYVKSRITKVAQSMARLMTVVGEREKLAQKMDSKFLEEKAKQSFQQQQQQ